MRPVISISAFLPDDVSAYKSIRLEALKMEPGMFGNSHAYESAFTEQQWLDRLTNKDAVCFGLYFGKELIGITSVVINGARPEEAYMTQSYIRKEYRGQGLSRFLYEARLNWAKEKLVKRLIIGHRASNLVSKYANQHYGFNYTHEEMRVWPDGLSEPMLYYELNL